MKKIKKMLMELASLNASPHNIALGTAIGAFISITPTVPLHTIFAFIFASIFNADKKAAMIAVWISNPITIPFTYAASYYMGIAILDIEPSNCNFVYELLSRLQSDLTFGEKINSVASFFKADLPIFYAMVVGGAAIGVPLAIGSYFLIKNWVKKFRKNKDKTAI
jgi:uncharacterized protein (DUF2062 family)